MNNKNFVFDTNVFISAALLPNSVNADALDKAFKTGKVVMSKETLAEFAEVLFRKKFDKYLTDERRLQIIQKLEMDTLHFEINKTVNACRDPKGQ